MARQTHDRNDEFVDENRRAIREAREADRVEPRAHAATYDAERALVFVRLRNGYAFGFAPGHIHGLEDASRPGQRAKGRSPEAFRGGGSAEVNGRPSALRALSPRVRDLPAWCTLVFRFVHV